ncbi:LA2681 family HEPN domain-containing protein [Agrobacterium tumefaciens]|uniref:LA2681 family HEPN domain-containing protein n=1 Tax=Agrobacterium tumefaciens TaxID=358 RepID=UPI001572E714|nr:LA2681 family HEPN domain-containing protein [Agrobacterium tumefaciens]WCK68984.1 LA2681 family HEPN domain-containing protein [Agrobacterium tumefaciens]
MNKTLLQRLFDLRDRDPLAALKLAEELGESPEEREAGAVVLIDCGDMTNSGSAVAKGVTVLELLIKERASPDRWYNLANGLQIRARLAPAASPDARSDRFKARVNFGLAISSKDATHELRSQAATNIGILLLETSRWVEALDYFQHAQRLWPRNGVAAFQEMRRLMGLASLFSREEAKYQSYCHLDALLSRLKELARCVRDNFDVVERLAGAGALAVVEETVADAIGIEAEACLDLRDGYLRFIRDENLPLSIFVSDKEYHARKFDLLTFWSIAERDDNLGQVPEIFAMINVIKGDFAFARQMFFEALSDKQFQETASHGDTLDYAVYGVRFSALTASQRIAFDILDKIAVLLACHLSIKDAYRIDFMKLWGRRSKNGFEMDPAIQSQLTAGNPGISALHGLFEDISKDDVRGDGFMEAHKRYRNASTHRFTVLHDEGPGKLKSRSRSIEHESLQVFSETTLGSLRLARAAIFYCCDAINFVEGKSGRSTDKPHVTLDVPDHDYIRGRSNRG